MGMDARSAKEHLEYCMNEQYDYGIGKAHCRLASLYPDYDPLLTDVTEMQFYLKWDRVYEAVPVLERLIKTHGAADEAWVAIQKVFLCASEKESKVEKELFTEISCDTYELIIAGLTKRFDSDDLLKTKLLLFCLRNGDENKFGKLMNRAVVFLTERASNDKDLIDGIGKYHLCLAVVAAPALLKLNFTNISASRVLSVIISVLHVAIAWPKYSDDWIDIIEAVSDKYITEAVNFTGDRFKICTALFDKCILLFDLGTPIDLYANTSGCKTLLSVADKACNLKSEARKIAFAIFMWYAYVQWEGNMHEDESLVWIPEDNRVMDVDKLLSNSADCVSPKRPKMKERKEEPTTSYTDYLTSKRRELCDAYELCYAAISAHIPSISVEAVTENLYFASSYPNVKRFIMESFLFKSKINEAIMYAEAQMLSAVDPKKEAVLYYQLACAHCIDRNWSDACDNVISMLTVIAANLVMPSVEEAQADEKNDSYTQPCFVIVPNERLKKLIYDVAYHIFFRVYTSTALDHDNDQLLGALLILSQINFARKGYRCFNRIMRYVEAKGSLKCAGLVKHISNIAVLEELSRIQDYCAEYVSIQIAVPQGQRRIGQSTRHSMRGTKDGQKQSIEEQLKKCCENPYATVSDYFIENREAILKMVGAKI